MQIITTKITHRGKLQEVQELLFNALDDALYFSSYAPVEIKLMLGFLSMPALLCEMFRQLLGMAVCT